MYSLANNSQIKSGPDYNWSTVSCTYTQCRVVANFKILLPGDGNSLVFRYATWCTRSESLSGSDPSAVNTTRDPWASVVISVPDERALVAAGTLKKRNILKKKKKKKRSATLTIVYSSYRILPGYNFVDWSFMKTFDNLLSSTVLRRIVKYSRSKNFFSGTGIHTMNCILRIIFFSQFFLHLQP